MIQEYRGFEFRVINDIRSRARKTVTIEKIKGDWPEDSDLITMADNYRFLKSESNLRAYHFGGVVRTIDDKTKKVVVYTD